MLSLKSGEKIATIVGGKRNGESIYIRGDSQDPIKLLSKEFRKKHSNLKIGQIRELHTALRDQEEPSDKSLLSAYKEGLEDISDKTAVNKFNLPTSKRGRIQVVPRKSIVEKLYVSGVSGSGKSTYVGKYLKQYSKMYPDNRIIVFSSVDEDEALDKFDPVRVDIDDTLIEEPLEIDEFQDSITVFDDTNTIRSKKHRQAVDAVQAELIEIGRHYNARCIVTSHIISDYRRTRQILNEATSVTFFPKASGAVHIKNFLKNYAGLSKEQIAEVFRLPSRWVTIYRTFPSYIVWEKGICLLSEFC